MPFLEKNSKLRENLDQMKRNRPPPLFSVYLSNKSGFVEQWDSCEPKRGTAKYIQMMYCINTNYLELDPFVKDNDSSALSCSEFRKERKHLQIIKQFHLGKEKQ